MLAQLLKEASVDEAYNVPGHNYSHATLIRGLCRMNSDLDEVKSVYITLIEIDGFKQVDLGVSGSLIYAPTVDPTTWARQVLLDSLCTL